MKNNLKLFYESIKTSVLSNPIAILAFIITVMVTSSALAVPTKVLVSEIEHSIYQSFFTFNQVSIEQGEKTYSKEGIIKLGDTLSEINKNALVDDDGIIGIDIGVQYIPMYHNGKIIDDDTIGLMLAVNMPYFTEEQIKNKEKVIAVSGKTMYDHNLKIGDMIEFAGTELKIIGETDGHYGRYYIPYTVDLPQYEYDHKVLTDDKGQRLKYPIFFEANPFVYRAIRLLTIGEKRQLAEFGIKQTYGNFIGVAIIPIAIVIVIIIVGVITMYSVLGYLQRASARKFTIYKLLGTSPIKTGGLMLAELAILTGIGIAMGYLVDYIIASIIPFDKEFVIDKMRWLYDIMLIGAVLLTTFTTAIISIVKILKSKTIDFKKMG